jgi:hypothetical protein
VKDKNFHREMAQDEVMQCITINLRGKDDDKSDMEGGRMKQSTGCPTVITVRFRFIYHDILPKKGFIFFN